MNKRSTTPLPISLSQVHAPTQTTPSYKKKKEDKRSAEAEVYAAGVREPPSCHSLLVPFATHDHLVALSVHK